MVFLVKNSTKKGAKIQNEYIFLLKCIMATSWIGNIYFSLLPHLTVKGICEMAFRPRFFN